MTREQKTVFESTILIFVFCLWLMGFVFVGRGGLYINDRSIFTVVQSTTWDHWGDWVAAWCGLKITIASFCAALFAAALGFAFWAFHYKRLTVGLSIATCLGVWVGLYYTLKAVF